MTTKTPDPRHRAVEIIEHALTEAGCDTSPHLARWLVARLEACGLTIRPIPRPPTDPAANILTDPAVRGDYQAGAAAARAALHAAIDTKERP